MYECTLVLTYLLDIILHVGYNDYNSYITLLNPYALIRVEKFVFKKIKTLGYTFWKVSSWQ